MTIEEDIKELKEMIKKEDIQVKTKKFRLPFRAKVGNGKAKKGWIGILKINENGVIAPLKQQIVEQTTLIDGVPRIATADTILKWKVGRRVYPIIIQPSWSVEPFSPKENLLQSMNNGSNMAGYRILLNRMKLSQVEDKPKKSMAWLGWIIGLGLLGLIGYALWTGGLG